ncbi:hypothetical protein HPB47_021244 [Ixodes persulcatus]|uniref:Uncharacterized protein n=1 Tax=Ixodes persulcatus TaxID=34615 RepID=A0AC60QD07_IXOPE|nr:hypothetical protein HPB47_021244 [Ixodes persulcatus]
MQVTDLKRKLKARGRSTIGSKSELLDRLQATAEVPGDFLRTVQCEEASLDSDGELSADVLLPEGLLRALTEDKEGAVSVSDFEGSFLTSPESMPTSGEIQDGSLLSSQRLTAARVQCRPDEEITVQAPQQVMKLIDSPRAKSQEPLTGISCKGCAILEQLCQTHQKALEELGLRLNGFADRLQQTETDGSALKQLHRNTAGGDSAMGSPDDAVFFGWAVLGTGQQHGQHLVQKDGWFSHSFLEASAEPTYGEDVGSAR